MSSKIELCNMALVMIGKNRVTDLDSPTTNEEKVCSVVFDTAAEWVMADASWTSVMKRISLVKTVNTPAFGFNNEYQLPTSPKCLHVVSAHGSYTSNPIFVVEGDKLLTNLSDCAIIYRAKIENPSDWDSQLSQAYVYYLKHVLANILTGDKEKAKEYLQEYAGMKQTLLATNNQQGSHQITESSILTDVR